MSQTHNSSDVHGRVSFFHDNKWKMSKFAILLAVAFLLSPVQVRTQERTLDSLAAMMGTRSGWDNDVSEVAYVGARCGALFLAVGGYLSRSGNSREDKQSGLDFTGRAKTFTEASMLLGKMSKISVDATLERSSSILKQYLEIMAKNKRDLNNALHAPIEGDLKFCAAHQHNYDYVMDLANKAKK